MLEERRNTALDEIETYVSQALDQDLDNPYRLPRSHDDAQELQLQQLEAVARLLALLPTSQVVSTAQVKKTTTRKRKK